MKGRWLALLRAIGALILLAALVVGVPALLIIIVGNPFPSTMPTLNEVRILLTQQGDGFAQFLIAVLAGLIWFIWVQLIVALIVEIVATIRQSETRRIAVFPGIQSFAARMIAAITLATTIATAPVLAPAVGALSFGDFAPVAAVASVVVDAPHMTADAYMSAMPDESADVVDANAASATVVVNDHTELWDLAEAAYGDGVSWKLIAQANAGVYDADGSLITDDTETVAPNTQLRIPGVDSISSVAGFGTVAEAGVAGAADTDDHVMHVIEKGDSMWSVAQDLARTDLDREPTDAETTEYWTQIVDANSDTPSGDVDMIYPGDELEVPQVESAPADSAEADDSVIHLAGIEAFDADDFEAPVMVIEGADGASPTADVEADADADLGATAERAEEDTTEESPSSSESEIVDAPQVVETNETATTVETSAPDVAIPAGVYDGSLDADDGAMAGVPVKELGLAAFGASVLSAGVVAALRRRRDQQRRMRPVGTMPLAPSTEAEAFAVALRHSSEAVHASSQGYGWRMLPVEAVGALRSVGPLEIHADDAGHLHAIAVEDTGDTSVPRYVDLISTTDIAGLDDITDTDFSGPDTVFPDDEGLSVAPTTVVAGTDITSGSAVLIDLAAAGQVELVGDDTSVRTFARSAVLDLATSERADDLCVIAVNVADELADLERVRLATSFPDALTHAVRCGHATPDATTPVVVVAGTSPGDDTEVAEALRDLGAVVVAPGVNATAQIVIDGDTAQLLPAETTVALAAFDDEQFQAIAELVEATSPNAAHVSQSVHAEIEDDLDVAEADTNAIEAGAIDILVLGPVEVVGAQPFSSLKAVDVLAYLAFHRHGADADQIKSWVWPPFDPPSDKALANVLSRARTALGADENGSPYLSKAGADKTYRLDAAVTTDFERFRSLVELADAVKDQRSELASLRQALELIRGVPFTGGTASSFAWADNHVRAQVEFLIDETVHRCADLALELGDLDTARWAALKGLEFIPGCEQCFRRRFEVAGAGRNRTELRRAMADLERSAAAELGEPEAVDSISEKLLELYHQLDQGLVAGAS